MSGDDRHTKKSNNVHGDINFLYKLLFEESSDLLCILQKISNTHPSSSSSLSSSSSILSRWNIIDHNQKAWSYILGYHSLLVEQQNNGQSCINFETLIHPDDLRQMNEIISSLLLIDDIEERKHRQQQQQQKQQQKLDVRIQKSDGTYRWISWMIKILPTVRDESTSSTPPPPILLSLAGRDVTDQKERHVRLLEKQKRLQDSHRIARLGQWDLDLVTNKLEWSEWIYQLFQMDPKEFGASYEAFLNAIHPDGRFCFVLFCYPVSELLVTNISCFFFIVNHLFRS